MNLPVRLGIVISLKKMIMKKKISLRGIEPASLAW